MGILFVLSGLCFLAGVLDPPILPTRAVRPPMPWPPPRHTGRRGSPQPGSSHSRSRPGWPQSSSSSAPSTRTWRGWAIAVRGGQRTRPCLNHLRPRRDQHPARRVALARLVPRRPALGRRTRHRILRPTGTGRHRLPRPGDTANPRSSKVQQQPRRKHRTPVRIWSPCGCRAVAWPVAARARDNRRVCLTRRNAAALLAAPTEVPARWHPSVQPYRTYLHMPLCGRATGQASHARRRRAGADLRRR
jgi:hypothetical protein